jgi:hypothetical protein
LDKREGGLTGGPPRLLLKRYAPVLFQRGAAGAAPAISPASDWWSSGEGKTGEGNGEAREAAVLLVRESSDKEKDYGEVVLVGNGGGV